MPDVQMTPGDARPNRYGGKTALTAAVLAVIAAGSQAPDILHAFLEEKEAVRFKAYPDSKGIWTVCEGLTRWNGQPVRKGLQLTKEQCDAADGEVEARDMVEAEAMMRPEIWALLAPTTRAALGSLVHNFGKDRASGMSAVRDLNAGRLNEGCAAITLWIRDGGKDCRKAGSGCQGQPLRRMQEDQLCLGVTPEQAQRELAVRVHRGPAS